jgi:hypothetical protein
MFGKGCGSANQEKMKSHPDHPASRRSAFADILAVAQLKSFRRLCEKKEQAPVLFFPTLFCSVRLCSALVLF